MNFMVELLNNLADIVLFVARVTLHAYFPAHPMNLEFSLTLIALHKKSLFCKDYKKAALILCCPGLLAKGAASLERKEHRTN